MTIFLIKYIGKNHHIVWSDSRKISKPPDFGFQFSSRFANPLWNDSQSGVRIFTFFLYLNDVEAGGATHFDKLDLTVIPKTGRALVWPHVLDEDPNEKDSRTTHAALPVEKGLKHAANAWYHMSDFQSMISIGCDF